MRSVELIALLLLICLFLTGCNLSGEVENQAYVLMLGIDRLPDGQLQLSARIPQIGKSDSKEETNSPGGSGYLTFSVCGAGWEGALKALEWATPRRANLSHIEMLVVSEVLASESSFPALLRQVTETPHLYATARLVVCEGSAEAFVDAGEAIMGTRMSADLRAMMRHYADQGYIPDCCLADVYFAAGSIYSDPVAIYAALNESTTPSFEGQDALHILESPMRQRYCGAALLRQGIFVKALTLPQTQLLNLMLGRSNAFHCTWGGRDYALSPQGGADLDVAIADNGGATLRLCLNLTAQEELDSKEATALAQALRSSIESLIRECQALRCDPFRFSERAAGHFLTVPNWLAFDWRNRYATAALDVTVTIAT